MTGKLNRLYKGTRQGDLFEVPMSDGRFGYGIVATKGRVLYCAFFRNLYKSRPGVTEILADEVALVGTTMDSLLYHGRWSVIARDQPVPALPFPNWKVNIENELRATDFEGASSWPITPEEVELLDYKWSRAPVAFQNALEALNGLKEWQASYDKLTFNYAARRVTRG